MNWEEIIKSIAPNLNVLGTFMPSKFTFKYDWFKNPTILGLYAGSESNDSFAFSKGDVVNAIGLGVDYPADAPVFDKNSVLIENVKFDSAKPESIDNTKTIRVPIEYLEKIDDSTPVTLQTGVNFGQNTKPIKQATSIILPNPVMPLPIKQLPYGIPPITSNNVVNQKILQKNASFVLNKDFQYVSGYKSNCNSQSGICQESIQSSYATLKSGTKVVGTLYRETNNITYTEQAGVVAILPYKDYLTVKGYGVKGSIDIPIDYLMIDNSQNNGVVVPAKNDNKNLFMIAGAFLVGYFLFKKDKNE